MTLVMKFANGAEIREVIHAQLVPEIFQVNFPLVADSPEKIHFWFRLLDELPSGAVVFVETTEESVREKRE